MNSSCMPSMFGFSLRETAVDILKMKKVMKTPLFPSHIIPNFSILMTLSSFLTDRENPTVGDPASPPTTFPTPVPVVVLMLPPPNLPSQFSAHGKEELVQEQIL